MTARLAWANLTHHRFRTGVALGGVAFAILLVFMQLGFYGSCVTSAAMGLDLLAFDVALVSPHYVALRQAGAIAERRLQQAAIVPGVASVTGLHVGVARWRNSRDGDIQEVLAMGFDLRGNPFALPEIGAASERLRPLDTALVDRIAHPKIGPHQPGSTAEISGRDVRLVGDYVWGAGFNALGAIVVGETTYRALVPGSNLDTFQLGLVRVAPGEPPAEVAARLRAALPPDVVPLTRDELLARERFHYVRVKPTGLMFLSGVVVACLVGTVILFQVLAADVARHLREYATLQAMGYRAARVQAVVVQQGFLFGTLGFVPAALLAALLYRALAQATNLPLYMSWSRLVIVFLASIGMCAFAGLLAVRRVTRVDPADLF